MGADFGLQISHGFSRIFTDQDLYYSVLSYPCESVADF